MTYDQQRRLGANKPFIMDVTESKPYFSPSKVIVRLHELSLTNRKAAEDFVETRWLDC